MWRARQGTEQCAAPELYGHSLVVTVKAQAYGSVFDDNL